MLCVQTSPVKSNILLPCPFIEDPLTVHLTFLPKLKADLEAFVEGWNNHPLRTEGNKTPEQNWHSGMMLRPIDQPENLEVLFFPFKTTKLLQ